VHLQINNPGKEIRTGDGINYQVNYTYNEKNAPLTKKGDGILTNVDGSVQAFKQVQHILIIKIFWHSIVKKIFI
jgi:hypothetical protein